MNKVDILDLFLSSKMRIFKEFGETYNSIHGSANFMADISQKCCF